MLTASEAAEVIGISVDVLRDWERNQIVRRTPMVGYKRGKFHRQDIDDALDRMRNAPHKPIADE